MTSPTEPHPPFARDTAFTNVHAVEDDCRSRDPYRMTTPYLINSARQNRNGIETILSCKWVRELEYRLMTESWAFDGATELMSVLTISDVVHRDTHSDHTERRI